MLGIGRTHFENVRNHLATNGIIPRVHSNVKNQDEAVREQINYVRNNRERA
jgi:hypothetical protein